MAKCLLAKEKYKFVDALKNTVDVPTVLLSELTDIVGAYIPNDVSKQAKRPCTIFIDGGRLATDRTDNVLRTDKDFSIKILGEIGRNAEFALLDTATLHYYSAVNIKMPCNQLGDTFEMQLLTESVLDETRYKETVEEIFEYYVQKDFADDVAKVVLFTVAALKDSFTPCNLDFLCMAKENKKTAEYETPYNFILCRLQFGLITIQFSSIRLVVYAVTHEYTDFGECYDFLYIPDYEEDWEDMLYKQGKTFYACAYVWNVDADFCSEFGTILRCTKSGIARDTKAGSTEIYRVNSVARVMQWKNCEPRLLLSLWSKI